MHGVNVGITDCWAKEQNMQHIPYTGHRQPSTILGHFGILGQFEDFLMSLVHLDCFPSHFRPFSSTISSLKKTHYGRTDQRTHGPTDGQ